MTNQNPSALAFYHADCIDGITSAWSVRRKYGAENIRFIGYEHHDAQASKAKLSMEDIKGKDILFVDISPDRSFLDAIILAGAKSVTIIDHHKDGHEELTGYVPPAGTNAQLDIITDAEHPSAAKMVWDHYFPRRKCPDFINMLPKMDVKVALVTSADFAAAALIDSISLKSVYDAFASLDKISHLSMRDLAARGSTLFKDQFNRVTKLDDNLMYTQIDGLDVLKDKWVPIVNADVRNFGRCIVSYLNDKGAETGAGMALAWCIQGNGKVSVSIRTDGRVDASAVAAHFSKEDGVTGGGHATSAAMHFDSITLFLSKMPMTGENPISSPMKLSCACPAHKDYDKK